LWCAADAGQSADAARAQQPEAKAAPGVERFAKRGREKSPPRMKFDPRHIAIV